jgi:hypothetical protein
MQNKKIIKILYINARINSDAHIARKIIASINIFIKKTSLSKNVTFAKKLTRYSILNILKNKEKKIRIKKTTKIKFLYYVVKTIEANKATISISIILKSAILFVQIINKRTKRKTIEVVISCSI